MNTLVLFLIVAVLLVMSSCTDETVNVQTPHTMASIAADYRNAPILLHAFERDGHIVQPLPSRTFSLRINGESITGDDGCNRFYATYRISGDSAIVTSVGTNLLSCRPPADPKASDLYGHWGVTAAVDRFVFTGGTRKFEFDCTYGAPVTDLPLVRGRWILAGSDDTLMTKLRTYGAMARLELRADRTVNLWWDTACGWSESGLKGFSGHYGVSRDSGILLVEDGLYSCGSSFSGADAVVPQFAAAFFESSRYAASSSWAVFVNTKRHTYYRFVEVP